MAKKSPNHATHAKTAKARRLHYVLSTHWDREWYQPLQDYRFRLVQLIDRVIDGIEDGRLKGPFQTDGQSIVLEDYLEIRPEKQNTVVRLARLGKLVVGPWYVMPDEFLVSGESIIRNIRMGRQQARDFGAKPSNAGFLCDMFGHNSQMPQLFAGFGIKGGFVWRGINLLGKAHLVWRGADGTEMPCLRFGAFGYCSYGIEARGIANPATPRDKETLGKEIEAYVEREAKRTEIAPVMIFDGGDHQEWEPVAYGVMWDRLKRNPDYELVHTSLDAYIDEMLPEAGKISTTLEGELREPALHPASVDSQWLIPGVLSSRVWIKLDNALCQSLLCHWAEPAAAFAHAALGRPNPDGYFHVAWKWLIQNHPHDSMCGCSIDQVHEDMKYRFSQSRQIANRQAVEAHKKLTAAISGTVGEDEMRVVVFNPLARPLDEVVELTLQIPAEYPVFQEFFWIENKPAFRVFDADDHELAYQRLGQEMNRQRPRTFDARFPMVVGSNDVRVAVRLSIPAMGYTTLTIRRGEPDTADPSMKIAAARPTRHPEVPGLAASERSMENAHLRVAVESNGSLTVTDKRTGATYERVLTFEDIADIGDGWYHGPAVNDQMYLSTASPAAVALVANGTMLATFRIRTTMKVPGEFVFGAQVRSETLVDMTLDSLVTLHADADRIEVKTTVNNTADDHRVRVLMPSGANVQTCLADSQFDVVERPIALRSDNHQYRELEVETRPQQSWTAVYDPKKKRGLAVVSNGLLETAVRDVPERTLALTLFRGTRRTVFTSGEPNGQVRGVMTFKYWIVPLAAEPDRTRLCDLGTLCVAGLRDTQFRAMDVDIHRDPANKVELPHAGSFLALEGEAVLSSARQVGDGFEVRLFNPHTKAVTARLDTGVRPQGVEVPTRAALVDFESQPLADAPELTVRNGAVSVTLKPKQIVTVRLS